MIIPAGMVGWWVVGLEAENGDHPWRPGIATRGVLAPQIPGYRVFYAGVYPNPVPTRVRLRHPHPHPAPGSLEIPFRMLKSVQMTSRRRKILALNDENMT